MRKFGLLPALIVASAALSSCTHFNKAGAGCGDYATAGPAADEIRKLELDGAATNIKGQTLAEAEQMFAPGYVSVGQNGAITTREGILKNYPGGKMEPWATRFEVKDLDVKVYCDMATAIGLAEALWKGAKADAKPLHFRWLNVWTRSNGKWRISATQFTRF